MGKKSRKQDMAEWATLGALIYGVHLRNKVREAEAFEKTRFVYKDPFVLLVCLVFLKPEENCGQSEHHRLMPL